MGQMESTPTPRMSHNAKNMLNVHAKNNYSDHHTIKFSRNDLVDTVSALDLNSVIELHGGASKNVELHNLPNRDRYTEYMSTKTMKMNGGNRGVVAGFSSASEGDLSLIKNMIMGTQTGGAGCSAPAPVASYGSPQITFTNNTMSAMSAMSALNATSASESGCGCETGNSVLQGGFDLGSILATQMTNKLTNSSSYNPFNSESDFSMVGGNMLSTESMSATSSIILCNIRIKYVWWQYWFICNITI